MGSKQVDQKTHKDGAYRPSHGNDVDTQFRGETVDTLAANCLPQLSRSQVYECLAYYEDHLAEVDYLVARQMADAGK